MRSSVPAFLLLAAVSFPLSTVGAPQSTDPAKALDERVTGFLERNRFGFRDMNVPEADGRALYDIVLKNGYKRALEIGTSTGHSGVWTAWALAKTGGRLITIDIDESRFRQALANFKQAGLDGYIDARLADAHDLVPRLEGPFDFVFIDADKEWIHELRQVGDPQGASRRLYCGPQRVGRLGAPGRTGRRVPTAT